ncbi:MAG: hypothetical protein A3G32_00690 [Deltaproteobacteria bacterium RIFCSPLOWO2_12_FULL_40_28]|nr:MAG: hypothetical protein A3C45_09575 [Deltaproteobacteria bacterium RIFCSPHIGHO2_02_FULL_40_28]OGQ19858.1 MAG: hypothetical protein A3E27_06525 [Deltaproteobacteria bacterium RIFCSPHIGHO2_12_FULL_40_32]OGQ39617.1 MAG: hypothetical protein A3I69_05955 [Deltaproteobacteria bacterium RIFCSPLOWO2_02_FULL_40_36]OGQ52873.1 MAG: hypothetical protein A3G32_00690 [Deltaproteobacteria bacterium RIFCSPLOWO2_12_FULL_40_28]
MTDPIGQTIVSKPLFIQKMSTIPTELDANQFLSEVMGILETGTQQNHSTEFMADQIFELTQQNPNLVSEMKFPASYLDIKMDVVNSWKIQNTKNIAEKNMPVLNMEADRKKSILENTPAIFEVAENPKADGSKPWFENHKQSQVAKYDDLIVKEAKAQNVDPDLVRAIMYMETTHGYYDKIYPFRDSILPMNINSEAWKNLGYSKQDLENPEINIHAGVMLIKRISERIKEPTVEKIATHYNALAKDKVTDYGARVGNIYHEKLWLQKKSVH